MSGQNAPCTLSRRAVFEEIDDVFDKSDVLPGRGGFVAGLGGDGGGGGGGGTVAGDGGRPEASNLRVHFRDELALARLGKKQVLRRNFDFMSMFAFTSIVIVSWEWYYLSVPSTYSAAAGAVYAYAVILLGNLCTFISISELASLATTAAGQYQWVYMLAPRSCQKFLSYLTGWLTIIAWQGTIATCALSAASIVQGLIQVDNPDYKPTQWQATLLMWAFSILPVAINTVGSILLPVIELAFLLVHVLGFIAFFIILSYIAPHGSAAEVFKNVASYGDWSTPGLGVMVGMANLAFVFTGTDAAVHMSEEMHNAATNVPKAVLVSFLVNAVMEFAIVITTTFGWVALDLTSMQGNPRDSNNNNFIRMTAGFTGNNGGAVAMTSIIFLMVFAASVGQMTTCSRVIWAFARDQGLPFSRFLSQVDGRSMVPSNAVVVSTAITVVFSIVNIGSNIALVDIVSLSAVGFYGSYLICTGFLLWHRVHGNIKARHAVVDDGSTVTDVHDDTLTWGPWHVDGLLGTSVNAFACVYLTIIVFFNAWPYSPEGGIRNVNYSVIAAAVFMICCTVYYLVHARKHYKGPVVEIKL